MGLSKPTGDLLRRPLQLQLVRHAYRQCGMQSQLTSLGPMRPVPRRLVGMACAVPFGAAVTTDLPTDRRRRPAQRRCNRADRMAGNQRPRHVFALGQAQGPDRPTPSRRPDATRLSQDPADRRVVPVKQPGDLVQRLALLPAIPHQGLLAVGVPNPCPSLHPQHSCCPGS